MMLQEARGIPRVQVLGEAQRADAGVGAAELLRGGQALIGVGGRHLDVDDRYVGMLGSYDPDELLGVIGLAHHLYAGLFQQPGRALPDQHGVVRDHDPHGISARIRVAPPATWPTQRWPPSAPTRSATSANRASGSWPGPAAASTVISMTSRSPQCFAFTVAPSVLAWALVSPQASAMRKYPAASTGAGSRSCVRAPTLSGVGLPSASASTAAASPSSASTAGEMPWARSRSSSMASRS